MDYYRLGQVFPRDKLRQPYNRRSRRYIPDSPVAPPTFQDSYCARVGILEGETLVGILTGTVVVGALSGSADVEGICCD